LEGACEVFSSLHAEVAGSAPTDAIATSGLFLLATLRCLDATLVDHTISAADLVDQARRR
jgi:hypothetical protein